MAWWLATISIVSCTGYASRIAVHSWSTGAAGANQTVRPEDVQFADNSNEFFGDIANIEIQKRSFKLPCDKICEDRNPKYRQRTVTYDDGSTDAFSDRFLCYWLPKVNFWARHSTSGDGQRMMQEDNDQRMAMLLRNERKCGKLHSTHTTDSYGGNLHKEFYVSCGYLNEKEKKDMTPGFPTKCAYTETRRAI
eukprot:TRINITY_DN48128_c0_g1_i1.p1 TRINITY_DN48128_c0_g1~~TRINITY_DN48128_c0_g1_i1.p1  ORF type:complete len:213 (+),score=14.40 TRINITY_DN48128_c0_g1_i1:63-641(+)